jgi:hypothetical protein
MALPADELIRMSRLYAATGDGSARLDEVGGTWTTELFLSGSGARCIAVDPADRDTVFAGRDLKSGGPRAVRVQVPPPASHR